MLSILLLVLSFYYYYSIAKLAYPSTELDCLAISHIPLHYLHVWHFEI